MTSIFRIFFLLGMGFLALKYGYEWLMDQEGGMEAFLFILGVIGSIAELFFNLIDKIFGSKEKPRLQFEEIGVTQKHSPTKPCKKSPRDEEGNFIGRQKNGIYEWDLNWSYNLIIRNNSNYHAFNPKIHLKKKFKGISFPGMNNYKPDGIYFFKERYVLPINNLHEKEPIRSGEKNLIIIKFTKTFQGTQDERDRKLKSNFPPELRKFEILFELENGEGNSYFTLIKKRKDKWLTKNYVYKPLKYLI